MSHRLLKIKDSNHIIPIFGVVMLGLAAKYVYRLYSSSKQKQRLNDPWYKEGFKDIPSPSEKYPYIGHMLSLGDNPSFQLEKLHQELGPIFRLQMGTQRWVLLSDPLLAHDLFVRNGINTSGRHPQKFSYKMYSKGGRGIVFSQPDKKWKNSRTVVLRAVFGKTTQSPDDPFIRQIVRDTEKGNLLVGSSGNLTSFLPGLSWIEDLYHGNTREKLIEHRDQDLKKLIADAVDGDVDCLAKQMMTFKDEYGLDDQDMLVILSDLISAGEDTTSLSMSWLFGILPHYPDIQRKMCAEIDAIVTKYGRMPVFSDREEMPYIVAVLRENLRFRSSVNFSIPRYSTDDIEFHEYFIPKDTVLITSMYTMHMRPENFSEPEKFIPERFLDDMRTWSASANGAIEDRDMYAFGWGRRVCPGIYLAEVEIFNVMVRTLSRHTIEPGLDSFGNLVYCSMDTLDTHGITFGPKDFTIRLVERKDSSLNYSS
ncbi:hypothetical protein F4703DRAFT_1927808 [Phycomyces blakesleeanus]